MVKRNPPLERRGVVVTIGYVFRSDSDGGLFGFTENNLIAIHIHQDVVAGVEFAGEQADRQRALDIFLQGAAHRASAKAWIKANFG